MPDAVSTEVPLTEATVDDRTREFLRKKSNQILTNLGIRSVIFPTILSVGLSTFNFHYPGQTSGESGAIIGLGTATLLALKDVYQLRNAGKVKKNE